MEDEGSRLKQRLVHLLKFEGEDRVRHFLRKTLPTTHGAFTSQTLSEVLETKKSVMNDLLNGTNGRHKVLSGEQYDLLFPVSGHVSPGSLDIAVMFLLIRYLCRTRSIAWEGWDVYPSPAQKTPVHDIVRVHGIYQDLVVKATTAVTSDSFASLWDELSSAILRLGGLRDRVERWKEDVPASELPTREREQADSTPGSPEGASAAQWLIAPYPSEGQALSRSFSCDSESSEGSALCSQELEMPPSDESTNPKQTQPASAAAAPSGVQQYYLSNVQNVQIGMQTQMSIASEGSQGRTSSEIAAEDHLELVMTSCRLVLRNEYRRNLSRIQPLPWNKSFCVPIDDVYTNLDLLEETMEGFKVNRVSLRSMEDIFRPRKKLGRRRPLRIVMQGQAGVGKTTSLTKLAVDWSTEKVQALKRINLAFVLRLRLIGQGMGIIDAIFEQLMPKGFPFTKEDLAKCLEEKQDEVLILLDGYDEFDSAKCPDIAELLRGRMYPRAVVMTTTRPSKIDEIQPTADTVVEITGFSPDNVRQYLERHFQGQEGKVEELLQHLEPHITNRGIATIPMFTMLISVLYEDKPDIVLPATITGLYKELMSCIIKRYHAKHGEGEGSGDIASLLEIVSKVAFECLLSDQVSFGEADLLEKVKDNRVAELGVFTYDDKQTHSRVNGGRHLTFSHKTIQEYLAGCHLASVLTTSKKETKKYLTSIDTLQRASELKYVILFACGTSERAATALIEHLLRIWKNSSGETKKQKQQGFVKLILQCLYESAAKDKIQLPVFELFPSGKVEFYDVSADVVKYLAHYLQHLKQVEAITEVSLGDVRGASLQDADDLGTALLRLNVLKTLRISRSPQFKVKPITEKLEKMQSLQHLYLCGMDLRQEGKALAVALKRMHRAKRTLRTLRVADNNFSKEASASLLSAIGKLTSLTDVDVSVNDLGDTLESLSVSLQHLSELRTLNLRESDLTLKACVALGNAFNTCPLGQLEECNLEGNQVDDRASVQVLLEGLGSLTNLRNLNLKGCRIGPDGAVTLSGSLQTLPHLKVVNLEGNGLDLRAAKSLFTSLHHCSELETIDLNTNFLGSQGVAEFAANFEKAGSVTSLNLSHNVMGDEGLEAVSKQAHHLKHLQYLELSDNPVTNDGFGAFFKNLPEMAELKELDISGPYGGKLGVTDDCVDHLSEALSRVPNLEVLHLRRVAMTTDGFDTFMEAAENHGKLATVSYRRENLPDGSAYSDSRLLVLW